MGPKVTVSALAARTYPSVCVQGDGTSSKHARQQ